MGHNPFESIMGDPQDAKGFFRYHLRLRGDKNVGEEGFKRGLEFELIRDPISSIVGRK